MMAPKGYRSAKFADRPVALQVTANIGGKVVVTTNYELFLGVIKAGIKGNTQARKLVLDFLIARRSARGAGRPMNPRARRKSKAPK
jgi:putative effector of murein hydrolase